VYLFGSNWGCPNAPKEHKHPFSGCFGPFLLLEWAYCFGKVAIFKLRHWYIQPGHLRVCVHLFGSIWGCPNAPEQDKKLFSGGSGPFPLQEWAYLFGKRLIFKPQHWNIHPTTCRLLSTFLGPFGGAKMPQTSTKNLFSGWSGPLIFQEWA
jgi:hypothetical protein